MLIFSEVNLFISKMTKADVELLHVREKKLKFIQDLYPGLRFFVTLNLIKS